MTKKVGLFRRLGAIFYDVLLVFSLILAMGLLFILLLPQANNGANSAFFFIVTMPVSFFYFAISWIKTGQTLGMKAWKIRLKPIKADNEKITLKQCLSRYFLAIISWLLLGGGFFYQWFNPQHYTLHDRYSNTYLEIFV